MLGSVSFCVTSFFETASSLAHIINLWTQLSSIPAFLFPAHPHRLRDIIIYVARTVSSCHSQVHYLVCSHIESWLIALSLTFRTTQTSKGKKKLMVLGVGFQPSGKAHGQLAGDSGFNPSNPRLTKELTDDFLCQVQWNQWTSNTVVLTYLCSRMLRG